MRRKRAESYPKEIGELLFAYRELLTATLAEEIVGIYLFGSLTYDDFQPDRSDIDLVIIVRRPLSATALAKVTELHTRLGERFPRWSKRLEASYLPIDQLELTAPPANPRPWYGEGRLYPAAHFGNEWLINNHLLREHGLALWGPPFALICPPIAFDKVQDACKRDLLEEWLPKLDDAEWMANPHYQSYLVLNLCRILHTICNGATASKSASSAWVARRFPRWKPLIAAANAWRYGDDFPHHEEAGDFLHFVLLECNQPSIKSP